MRHLDFPQVTHVRRRRCRRAQRLTQTGGTAPRWKLLHPGAVVTWSSRINQAVAEPLIVMTHTQLPSSQWQVQSTLMSIAAAV